MEKISGHLRTPAIYRGFTAITYVGARTTLPSPIWGRAYACIQHRSSCWGLARVRDPLHRAGVHPPQWYGPNVSVSDFRAHDPAQLRAAWKRSLSASRQRRQGFDPAECPLEADMTAITAQAWSISGRCLFVEGLSKPAAACAKIFVCFNHRGAVALDRHNQSSEQLR